MNRDIAYRADCFVRREAFGALLTNRRGRILSLDDLGGMIVAGLRPGWVDAEQLVRCVANQLAVDEGGLRESLTTLLRALVGTGLVERCEGPCACVEDEAVLRSMQAFEQTDPTPYPAVPHSLHLYLWNACQQHCEFCYLPPSVRAEDSTEMDLDLIEHIVDQAAAMGTQIVNVIGGEPTLRPARLLEVLERLDEKGLFAGFATNGGGVRAFSDNFVHALSRFPNLDVRFSIHARTPQLHDALVGLKGSHAVACDSLRRMLEVTGRASVSMVATRKNLHEVLPLLEWTEAVGATSFSLLAPLCEGDAEWYSRIAPSPSDYAEVLHHLAAYREEGLLDVSFVDRWGVVHPLPELRVVPMDYNCGAGMLFLEIAPEGDVYPCSLTIGDDRFRLGNARSDSLEDLWRSPVMKRFRERSSADLRSPGCQTCTDKEVCRGGCPMGALKVYGDMNAGDPFCPRLDGFDAASAEASERRARVWASTVGSGE